MPNHPSAPKRYTLPAIALHWLLALLILVVFSVGLYMADLPRSPERNQLFDWHKWFGLLILALSLLRLAWRATHQPPPDLPMPSWQIALMHRLHQLMYLLFFAVPLLGWAHSSAAGSSIVWFGLLHMPALLGPDKALAEITESLHAFAADGLMVLIGLHVAAAFKHHWIDRDGLLQRMLPGRN